MSYIGNKPATNFETVQKQISTSNSGTTITLDRAVTSVQDILLTIDAVVQSYDNYSVSGTTLTVGGTLNNNRVEILYVGRTMQSVDPTDDSVSAAKIKTDAVTTAKVQNDAITVDKLNLISTSSVPSLEAKGDGSSQDGYIQLNCSQNSHGVKLKSPPHSANQSYTLTLPSTAPATDKMLQTNSSGVLSFVDAPSGTHVKVAHSRSTSQVSNITFDNIFTSSYSIYYITGFMQGTANGGMYYYLRDASGSALYSDGYNTVLGGARVNSSTDGTYSTGNFGTQTGAQISMNGDDSSTTSPICFETIVYDPRLTTTSRCHLSTRCTLYGSDNYFYTQIAASRYKNNTVATGIYLYFSSGSIKYHDVTIYGISGTGV